MKRVSALRAARAVNQTRRDDGLHDKSQQIDQTRVDVIRPRGAAECSPDRNAAGHTATTTAELKTLRVIAMTISIPATADAHALMLWIMSGEFLSLAVDMFMKISWLVVNQYEAGAVTAGTWAEPLVRTLSHHILRGGIIQTHKQHAICYQSGEFMAFNPGAMNCAGEESNASLSLSLVHYHHALFHSKVPVLFNYSLFKKTTKIMALSLFLRVKSDLMFVSVSSPPPERVSL